MTPPDTLRSMIALDLHDALKAAEQRAVTAPTSDERRAAMQTAWCIDQLQEALDAEAEARRQAERASTRSVAASLPAWALAPRPRTGSLDPLPGTGAAP